MKNEFHLINTIHKRAYICLNCIKLTDLEKQNVPLLHPDTLYIMYELQIVSTSFREGSNYELIQNYVCT